MLEFWELDYGLYIHKFASNVKFRRWKDDDTSEVTLEYFPYMELHVVFNPSWKSYLANPFELFLREDTGEIFDGDFFEEWIEQGHEISNQGDCEYIKEGTLRCDERRDIFRSFLDFFSRWIEFDLDDPYGDEFGYIDFANFNVKYRNQIRKEYFFLNYSETEPPEEDNISS